MVDRSNIVNCVNSPAKIVTHSACSSQLSISTAQKYYRRDRYGVTDLATRGANPGMKKCSLGKGTMLTASFLRSALSWPGNLRQVVTPDIVMDTKWFKSPYVGEVSFSVLINIFLGEMLGVTIFQT